MKLKKYKRITAVWIRKSIGEDKVSSKNMKVIDFHVHHPLDVEECGVDPRVVAEKIIEWMNREGIELQ